MLEVTLSVIVPKSWFFLLSGEKRVYHERELLISGVIKLPLPSGLDPDIRLENMDIRGIARFLDVQQPVHLLKLRQRRSEGKT